ncbi:Hypothetical_protein [Hexamita inflata]|uniref:Hypothetical_protein n=1 Tax=Hexamita inflata TaxID=28002 RepID=A0AA86U1I1_9EUKA|nr:Hypothetical protein HINF_LOCUS24374 [Hexamita inflata]
MNSSKSFAKHFSLPQVLKSIDDSSKLNNGNYYGDSIAQFKQFSELKSETSKSSLTQSSDADDAVAGNQLIKLMHNNQIKLRFQMSRYEYCAECLEVNAKNIESMTKHSLKAAKYIQRK